MPLQNLVEQDAINEPAECESQDAGSDVRISARLTVGHRYLLPVHRPDELLWEADAPPYSTALPAPSRGWKSVSGVTRRQYAATSRAQFSTSVRLSVSDGVCM